MSPDPDGMNFNQKENMCLRLSLLLLTLMNDRKCIFLRAVNDGDGGEYSANARTRRRASGDSSRVESVARRRRETSVEPSARESVRRTAGVRQLRLVLHQPVRRFETARPEASAPANAKQKSETNETQIETRRVDR